MRDDDIVVPPAVLRGCGRRVAEISDEITRPQMTETHSPPPLRGPLCILLEWQVLWLWPSSYLDGHGPAGNPDFVDDQKRKASPSK